MFELSIHVKVDTKEDGTTGKTTVTNTILRDGVSVDVHTGEFPHVVHAYRFVGDYFYDMADSLTGAGGILGILSSMTKEENE